MTIPRRYYGDEQGLELLSELLRFLKVKFLATKPPMLFLIQLRDTKVVKCIASMGEVQFGIRRLLGTGRHQHALPQLTQ
jgi:hypothetical protein